MPKKGVSKITVEELDIIVQASVEGAVKEFKKLLPAIQKQLSGVQKEFNNLKIKDITANIDVKGAAKEAQKAKKQIKEAFDPNDVSGIKFTGNIGKSLDEISMKYGKLKGSSKDLHDAVALAKYRQELAKVNSELDKSQKGRFIGYDSTKIQSYIENYGQNNSSNKETKIEPDTKNLSFWDTIKAKIAQAKKAVSEFVNTTKQKSGFSKMIPQLNGISGLSVRIKNQIKQWGTGFKGGLKHILKYAGALFSLRGIYSVLSSSASSWLSSQNAGAKQLSANIEYMKTAMGSAFALVIQYVTNLIYQFMKAIQSLVYAFSGINIFAKATASSMKNTAGSAKQASKSLSSVHSEINNVSENNGSGSGGGTNPNIDLSQMDTQMGPLAQKLYDFFKPLKDSWDNYGNMVVEQLKITAGQVGGLISTVWQSFEKIVTNGTVYKTLKLILAIIGNIAEAFKNAWQNNGNGDKIVQNLADAFNNVLNIIDLIVQSSIFQWLLDTGVVTIEVLTEAIEFVTEKLSEFIEFFSGENQEQLDGWAIIIGSIAAAILLVNGALAAYNIYMAIATALTTGINWPIVLIIGAIALLIAAIISIATHWDEISKALSDGWEWIKQKAEDIFNAIAEFFTNVWTGIKDTISNIINGIKNTISNVLNIINITWSNIWNGLKNTTSNVFNGIWNVIKGVINAILGGIEGMANGVVDGVNTVINSLNKIKFKMPDWAGGKEFGFNIGTIGRVSIPRLAKGGVLYDDTIVRAGEYSGASSNPEIVSPQNIMYDTMRRALEDTEFHNNSGQDIYLTLKVGDEEMAQVVIDKLGNIVRNSGRGLETVMEGGR